VFDHRVLPQIHMVIFTKFYATLITLYIQSFSFLNYTAEEPKQNQMTSKVKAYPSVHQHVNGS
jgi:hypothetical protein